MSTSCLVYQSPLELYTYVVGTEVLAMDLLGHFPESKEGTIYVLVITDHFSKFSVLHVIKKATGKVLAAILRHLFCMWWKLYL